MRRWTQISIAVCTTLWSCAALAVEVAGPSQEVIDKASESVAGSSVFGAAFIIMLGIFVSIVVTLLVMLIKNYKAHAKALVVKDTALGEALEAKDTAHTTERTEQEERHATERDDMRTEFEAERKRQEKEWNVRFAKYSEVLDKQYVTIGELQEKRVEQAGDVVAVAKDSTHQMAQVFDLLETLVGQPDEQGD